MWDRSHWVPDDERSNCHNCEQAFSLLRADKHHCRLCGEIFCAACSDHTRRLSFDERNLDPHGAWHRVCVECFKIGSSQTLGYVNDDNYKEFTKRRRKFREESELDLNRLSLLRVKTVKFGGHDEKLDDVQNANLRVVVWAEDADSLNCASCKKEFGLFLHKHHCRLCGDNVCSGAPCSAYTALDVESKHVGPAGLNSPTSGVISSFFKFVEPRGKARACRYCLVKIDHSRNRLKRAQLLERTSAGVEDATLQNVYKPLRKLGAQIDEALDQLTDHTSALLGDGDDDDDSGTSARRGKAEFISIAKLCADLEDFFRAYEKQARPACNPFASRSVWRALLTPQVNPGSLYHCGKIT